MKLNKILVKIGHIESLVFALEIIIDNYLDVNCDSYEEFNVVSSLIRLLKYKTKEVGNDISKHV